MDKIHVQLDVTEQTREDFLLATKMVKTILGEKGYDYEFFIYNGSDTI
ncbi:hypothetical protein [Radiobacillus sp. PE A8.2]